MNQISKNIKQLRAEKGWTQQEMADVLFVTRQTISNWENGKSMPDVDTLIQIAEKLNIDVNQLVYGKRKADSSLKKDILASLKWIVLMKLFQYIVNRIYKKYLINSFSYLALYLFHFAIEPVYLFFIGRLFVQIMKITGFISNVKGSRYTRFFKFTLTGSYAVFNLFQIERYRIEILRLFHSMRIGPFKNSRGFSGADYVMNLPRWWNSISYFFADIAFSGQKYSRFPFYLISLLLGIAYEFSKHYDQQNTPVQLASADEIIDKIIYVIKNPEKYCKIFIQNVKEILIFTKCNSRFIYFSSILLVVIYTLTFITYRHTTLFSRWMYLGFTAPLTMLTIGVFISIVIKHFVKKKTNFPTAIYYACLVIVFTIFLANFMTFLPEILREIMVILDRLGIITVTGSYDITGFVLRPPQWFSKIYHFLSNFNSSSQVWKWGILGFICGLARQYNDKYQHLYKRSQ